MYGDNNVTVEEVKCRCVCVRARRPRWALTDWQVNSQVWRLISPAGADAAAPAGGRGGGCAAFSRCDAGTSALLGLRCSHSPLLSQVHSGKHPGNGRVERGRRRGKGTPRGNSSTGGLGGGEGEGGVTARVCVCVCFLAS